MERAGAGAARSPSPRASPGQLQTLTIYPDSYGCAFAQVLPTGAGTGTYTVSVANASNGIPAGTSYGTPVVRGQRHRLA